MRTLRSSTHEAWHTLAQVIAKIAAIEIPCKQWSDLVGSLLDNRTQQDSPPSLKQATLETLGYVCEEISHEELEQSEVNAVLTAVVQGMNLAQHSAEIRLVATKALSNALGFAWTNFENETEQNNIMKVVCETATSKEVEIRQAAYECVVAIASMDYTVLESYMEALFELTSKALSNALSFAWTNFENETERNNIMKVVCETATSKEVEIRQVPYECLVAVASMYYKVLESYMEALFELTSKAAKEDEEAVALQAIEFWCSICDEGIDIQDSLLTK